MSLCEISNGMLWRTRALVSFIRSVFRNPCKTFATGRLVMKNLRGESRPANIDRLDKITDVAFSSLHSSKASMTTRHGGKASSRMAACKGSMTSFFTCLDGSVYCTWGSSSITLDKCFRKDGYRDDS